MHGHGPRPNGLGWLCLNCSMPQRNRSGNLWKRYSFRNRSADMEAAEDDAASVDSALSAADDAVDDHSEGGGEHGSDRDEEGEEVDLGGDGGGGVQVHAARKLWARDDVDPGRQTTERRNTGGKLDAGFKDLVDRSVFKTPLGAFDQIFTPALVESIVERTNPHLKDKGYDPTSVEELTRYLALLMAKSLKKQPTERSYTDSVHFGEVALFAAPWRVGTLGTQVHGSSFACGCGAPCPCVPSPAQPPVPPGHEWAQVRTAQGDYSLPPGHGLPRRTSSRRPPVRQVAQGSAGEGGCHLPHQALLSVREGHDARRVHGCLQVYVRSPSFFPCPRGACALGMPGAPGWVTT